MQWQQIPGLSIMVTQDGHLVKAKGYGLANIESGTLATAETEYKLASLSKQFVATGVMALVQDGRIHLNDSVTNYLDDVPGSWKSITVRHLLTHTSGIVKDSTAFDPFTAQPDIDVIRSVYDVPLQFAPGDAWSYSNIGYYVLAEIIHRVTSEPWPAYVQKRVFDAAGISGEHSADPAAIIPNRAMGYETRAGKLRNAEVWRAIRPSGGFLASAVDLALWDAALDDDLILDGEIRELLWTPVELNDHTTYGYGFGWFVEKLNGHLRVHHDGGVPGFSCDYERFPDRLLSVAVLTNIGQRDLRDVAIGVAAMFIPDLIPPFKDGVQDDDPEVTRRIRGVVGELSVVNLNEKEFTSELAGWLSGDLKNGFGERLHGLGEIQSFVLVSRETKDDDVIHSYRLEYRYMTLSLECTIGEDGRIKKLAIQS
jgi:CubicO group peptidase (beta-lactamase class C family)